MIYQYSQFRVFDTLHIFKLTEAKY